MSVVDGETLAPWLGRLLAPLGWIYGAGMAARNAMFDCGLRRAHRLPIPVVSVGNLRVGGTGKTPLVAWLLEQAHARGHRPAVLSRGYGRSAGAATNDEGALLARRYPWAGIYSDPDRLAAGRAAAAAGHDLAILDDGFQHRRLHRDVDLVCLDARQPFDRVLPAGMQRERRAGLRRAHGIVLTRIDLAGPEACARSRAVIAAVAPTVPVFASRHAARDLVARPDGAVVPLTELRDRAVWLLSAIARPATFAATVAGLGARIVGHTVRRDHAEHTHQAVEALAREAASRDAWLVVTEKDDVKLAGCSAARHVLRIDLEFESATPAHLLDRS